MTPSRDSTDLQLHLAPITPMGIPTTRATA